MKILQLTPSEVDLCPDFEVHEPFFMSLSDELRNFQGISLLLGPFITSKVSAIKYENISKIHFQLIVHHRRFEFVNFEGAGGEKCHQWSGGGPKTDFHKIPYLIADTSTHPPTREHRRKHLHPLTFALKDMKNGDRFSIIEGNITLSGHCPAWPTPLSDC